MKKEIKSESSSEESSEDDAATHGRQRQRKIAISEWKDVVTESVQQLPEGIDELRKYTIQPRLAPSLPLDSSEMGLFSNGFLRWGLGTEKLVELSERAELRGRAENGRRRGRLVSLAARQIYRLSFQPEAWPNVFRRS